MRKKKTQADLVNKILKACLTKRKFHSMSRFIYIKSTSYNFSQPFTFFMQVAAKQDTQTRLYVVILRAFR